MLHKLVWLFVLLEVVKGGLFLFDSSDGSSASNSTESSSSEESLFGELFSEEGGGGKGSSKPIKCGPKSKCPTHKCRIDPAVIHGYCCGCAKPSDKSPYLCPLDTQCPLNKDKLCEEFNYRIKCCCPEGVRDKEDENKAKEDDNDSKNRASL